MLLTKTKTNLLLSFILILYLFCCSKYIGIKNSIFSNKIYLLFLLICVIVVYYYHKQAGITLLIIAMATHSPVFRETFSDFTDTVTNKLNNNELENQESNYDISVKLRKNQLIEEKLKQEEPRMNQLEKEEIIQPLEKEIIREIQRKFEEDIDLIFRQIEIYSLSHPLIGWKFDSNASKQHIKEICKNPKLFLASCAR